MGFLNKIFKEKDTTIKTNDDFWNWFVQNEKRFFNVIQNRGDVEKEFFDELSPKLAELKDGYFFLTGMIDEQTADLILTADGLISNIVFVEELVAAAPKIDGWRFTALKPAVDIESFNVKMEDYEFKKENLSFKYHQDPDLPDEINLTIVHDDYNDENADIINRGTYIFLDNYLGELNFTTTIDTLSVTGKNDAIEDLIPIEKLKAFLAWREKEFIEKYEGTRHDTEKDRYDMLEATLKNGKPLLAIVNKELLKWDSKASHPWIVCIEVKYTANENGLPNEQDYQLLNNLEDDMMRSLKDSDGYLNIGRETAEGLREIYFACKDFRKPSKVLYEIKRTTSFELTYDIYKDKYWRSFDRYI